LLLIVDNGSVYTKSLLDFLTEKKVEYSKISFDKIKFSELDNFSSIILSGRRTNNKMMNAINSKIIKSAISGKKSLLGICYGAEILALTMGGTIKKLNQLHKGSEEIEIIKENPLSNGKLEVFESHSYVISKMDGDFTNIAKSKTCPFEIIQYKDLNIFGTQFHPEMSNDGKSLIEAFVSLSTKN